MLKRRRNARCTAVADSVLMNSRTQKILCCIVATLLSTDAAARLQASALVVVIENLGPSLSNVMQIIHIPCIIQEIQTYEIESIFLNHAAVSFVSGQLIGSFVRSQEMSFGPIFRFVLHYIFQTLSTDDDPIVPKLVACKQDADLNKYSSVEGFVIRQQPSLFLLLHENFPCTKLSAIQFRVTTKLDP